MSLTSLFNVYASPHSTPEQKQNADSTYDREMLTQLNHWKTRALQKIIGKGSVEKRNIGTTQYIFKVDRIESETQNQHRNRTRKIADDLVKASSGDIELYSNPHGGDFTGGRILISNTKPGSVSHKLMQLHSGRNFYIGSPEYTTLEN